MGYRFVMKVRSVREFSDPQCKYIALEYVNRALLMENGLRREEIPGGNKTNLTTRGNKLNKTHIT
jgi:hypothetical protein